MLHFFVFLAFVLSFLFPYFLIKAIELPETSFKKELFVAASCISFGLAFFVLESTAMYNG